MGPLLLLYALLLSWFGQTQVSSAETVFVQTGKDVHLNVKTDGLEKNNVVSWTDNANIVIVRSIPQSEPTISPNYTGRVEFSVKNYSLKLKNLQDTDSGVYTVRLIGTHKELTAKYNVRVQDPVSPVNLTVESVSQKSDSCNLTVTCRTQDSLINSTFRCDTKRCSEEGGERSEVITSGVSLYVYVVNDSIVCNHSNQVSWTKDFEMIEHFCSRHADRYKQVKIMVYVLVVVIILIVSITAAVCYCQNRGKDKCENIENTVYEVPQLKAVRQLDQSQTNDTLSFPPTSTYCLVGPHAGSTGSTKSGGNALPESLYAQVEKSARS